jgi:hypothetical protein
VDPDGKKSRLLGLVPARERAERRGRAGRLLAAAEASAAESRLEVGRPELPGRCVAYRKSSGKKISIYSMLETYVRFIHTISAYRIILPLEE